MYFDTAPKEKKTDIFNYEKEYAQLIEGIERERIVVLYGLRRTGKTSLMRTAYNSLSCPKVYIDVRSVMPKNKTDLENLFKKAFSSLENLIEKAPSHFGGVQVGLMSGGISIKQDRRMAYEIAESLDKRKQKIVVFIDEAQYLKRFGGDQFIGFLYDNTKHISAVLGGSEVGLLREFAGEKRDSPLYGRARSEIVLTRLGKEKCVEFLRKGFQQVHAKLTENQIEEVFDLLDGIIGWHVLYGHYSVTHGHAKALAKVKKEAMIIIKDEVNDFLSNKGPSINRYRSILRQLALRDMSWKELKLSVEKELKSPIAQSRFYAYLKNLLRHGFIEKKGEAYVLGDPLIPLVTSSRK